MESFNLRILRDDKPNPGDIRVLLSERKKGSASFCVRNLNILKLVDAPLGDYELCRTRNKKGQMRFVLVLRPTIV